MEGMVPGSPFLPVLHEYALLREFKDAQLHAPRGVYITVHPSGDWDGAVFVHSGLYEGGVFRFRMLIPKRHPTDIPPRVFFQTNVFHPQVNFETGELSTARHYPRWRPGKDKLWHVLKLVRHIFYSPSAKAPFNQAAAVMMSAADSAEFTARAQQCAIDSEKVEPCNNQLRFEERFDERGSTRLTNLMLKWGEQDEPSMAATLDFFEAAAVSDTAPQQHQSSNLRETLRTALGRPADTADTTLSASKCKGFLSIPDESGWQRRWAVLTYPPGIVPGDEGAATAATPTHGRSPTRPPISPRTPTSSKRRGSTDVDGPTFSLVFYEDKTEAKRINAVECGALCRAYQPPGAEMKSNNTFLVVLPDELIRLQAPSNNAVNVWLHALTIQA
eukprot:m.421388 g.421388  ORF g.421388 m.421388 type:complete len:387 (-) comp33921_c0_seq1:102-1262(-)